MCFQQEKLKNEHGTAEEEDPHVGMAEARKKDNEVKYPSHEKVRIKEDM